MAVQSIGTVVQIRDVAREHLLVIAREMSRGEVQCVRKLDHLPQKVGPRTEAFYDARNLASSRSGTPEVVCSRSLADGFVVFDNFDLGLRILSHNQLLTLVKETHPSATLTPAAREHRALLGPRRGRYQP